jgi:hypothetical protein
VLLHEYDSYQCASDPCHDEDDGLCRCHEAHDRLQEDIEDPVAAAAALVVFVVVDGDDDGGGGGAAVAVGGESERVDLAYLVGTATHLHPCEPHTRSLSRGHGWSLHENDEDDAGVSSNASTSS